MSAAMELYKLAREPGVHNKAVRLYRRVMKEMPRALTMYDISMSTEDSRKAIRGHFYLHKDVKDHRVRDMLVEKGYMELEETLMYYKQPSHLREFLSLGKGDEHFQGCNRKKLGPDSTDEEQYLRD